MIKLIKRTTIRAASPRILNRRIAYISNTAHPNHNGKTIHAARNYNCPDNSPETFRRTVLDIEATYQRTRAGRRGKRSRRLFEEIIYSTPEGAHLTASERECIETMLIDLIGRRTACRTAWHVDESTGRADLHILLAAKTIDYPTQVTLWADFGGSEGRHIFAEFNQLSSVIIAFLNRNPNRKQPLQSPEKVRKIKAARVIGPKPPLAAEIASKIKGPLSIDAIAEAIVARGHTVSKLTSRSVSVIFHGRTKPRRYNLEDLFANTAAERDRLLSKKPQSPRPDGLEMV